MSMFRLSETSICLIPSLGLKRWMIDTLESVLLIGKTQTKGTRSFLDYGRNVSMTFLLRVFYESRHTPFLIRTLPPPYLLLFLS